MSRSAVPSTIVTSPADSVPASEATELTTARARARCATPTGPVTASELTTRMRLLDRSIFDGTLGPARHRSVHLGLLHSACDGYVEIAAGRRPAGGKLRITTRRDPAQFLPGGAAGDGSWLQALLELAGGHAAAAEEVFVGPAVRRDRAAAKVHVSHTNWLWIDVDGADGLPAVRELLRDSPHI